MHPEDTLISSGDRAENVGSMDDVIRSRMEATLVQQVSIMAVARLIKHSNVSGSTVKLVAKKIPRELVADSMDVDPSNLSKLYQRTALSRSQTEELNELTQLWLEILHGLFKGDADLMNRWLNAPVPALEGSAPRELMSTFSGRKVLEGYLQEMRYGDLS